MLHNNLSNKPAPIIVFNFETIICEEFGKKHFKYYYKVNYQHVNAINKLFHKDFRILYLTSKWPDKKLEDLADNLELDGCYFNGMMKVKNLDSLKTFLQRNIGSFYFDTDDTVVDILYPHAFKWEDFLVQVWNKG